MSTRGEWSPAERFVSWASVNTTDTSPSVDLQSVPCWWRLCITSAREKEYSYPRRNLKPVDLGGSPCRRSGRRGAPRVKRSAATKRPAGQFVKRASEQEWRSRTRDGHPRARDPRPREGPPLTAPRQSWPVRRAGLAAGRSARGMEARLGRDTERSDGARCAARQPGPAQRGRAQAQRPHTSQLPQRPPKDATPKGYAQSANLNGHDPRLYLTDVLKRLQQRTARPVAQSQQSIRVCIDGHRIEPKEQNTQQSPLIGRRSALHPSHS
jgi:hypothetical protein